MAQHEKINNSEILESLRYARLIQSALLPSKAVMDKLLKDYFILFMPKTFVSGDFYWVSERNGKTIVVAADCTGHGVPGALMSILGISFLNEIVGDDNSGCANRILNKLREKVMEALRQTGDKCGSRDGIDLSLCIIDRIKEEAQFAGANNPVYLIRDNELIEYRADRMPVGINAVTEESFTNTVFKIRKNDVFYMFTDGLPDQFGGNSGKKFKYRPFKQLLTDIHVETMSRQKEILKDTLIKWMGENEQIDDILVIGFSIT